ncbi:MAG TPA: hypothetical protein VFG29_14725 [Syntrophales bacterium]|nr:hypothetical protein [Syntrophales bacterium]
MYTRVLNLFRIICGFLVIFILAGNAYAQELSPAHEQEFMDAKEALQTAQTAKADKYAPDMLKEANVFLGKAEQARSAKDDVQFTRSSHLARAYAESAKAWSELKIEQEKLSATKVELEKTKAEIQRLEKAK